MKSELVRRARRTTAVGVLGVFAVASVGCTSGGDGGDALSTDDGGEAAATIAGAVEDARASSGRYESAFAATSDYGEQPETIEWTVTGEFSGDASTSTWRSDGAEGDGVEMEAYDASTIAVDGRTYSSTSSIRQLDSLRWEGGGVGDDAITDLELSEGGRAFSDPFSDWDFTILDGKDWIDTTGLDRDDSGVHPIVASSVTQVPIADPFVVLDAAVDVRDVGLEDLDGTSARHFTATIPDDELVGLVFGADAAAQFDEATELGSGSGETPARRRAREERQAVIERYVDEHTDVTADLYLGADDQLLRVRVVASTDIEDQYDDCSSMFVLFDALSMTTDFSDLGGDVVIVAPDPATVVSLDDLVAAFPNTVDTEEWTSSTETTVASGMELGEPPMLQTVDGPRDRYVVLNDLDKFGYVIGVGVDPFSIDPRERGGRPEVWALSDADATARYDELAAALAALPHTTTALGELTRPELLWNVKWGLESIGETDPASADAFSDAELGALIDGYVAQRGGPVGDGVFGDLPEGVQLQGEGDPQDGSTPTTVDSGEFVSPQEYDPFEGCPA